MKYTFLYNCNNQEIPIVNLKKIRLHYAHERSICSPNSLSNLIRLAHSNDCCLIDKDRLYLKQKCSSIF